MTENSSSKFSYWMAVLGWIVAFLSLAINWIAYNESLKEKAAKEKEIPKFSCEIATYDTINLPKEIQKLKNEIRHNFIINHRAGRAVEKLKVELRSPNAEITDIIIEDGNQGIDKKIEPGGKEAFFSKATLLPSKSIRGYVTTMGISKLEFASVAKVGEEVKESKEVEEKESSIFDEFSLLVIVFLIIISCVIIILFAMALPALKDSGFIGELKKSNANFFLILMVIVFSIIPDSGFLNIQNLLSALIIYFILTNYRDIVNAVKRICKDNN